MDGLPEGAGLTGEEPAAQPISAEGLLERAPKRLLILLLQLA